MRKNVDRHRVYHLYDTTPKRIDAIGEWMNDSSNTHTRLYNMDKEYSNKITRDVLQSRNLQFTIPKQVPTIYSVMRFFPYHRNLSLEKLYRENDKTKRARTLSCEALGLAEKREKSHNFSLKKKKKTSRYSKDECLLSIITALNVRASTCRLHVAMIYLTNGHIFVPFRRNLIGFTRTSTYFQPLNKLREIFDLQLSCTAAFMCIL